MVRVGGWDGREGKGMLRVSCEEAVCDPSLMPVAEEIETAGKASVVNQKNRFLSFSVPDTSGSKMILVTFRKLPVPFDQFNNESMWVGDPSEMSEIASRDYPSPPNFWVAPLQCSLPTARADWNSFGTIHVHSPFIVPGGTYEIRTLDNRCPQVEVWDPAISPVLVLPTSEYGDLCAELPKNNQGQWGPWDGSPNITSDVLAVKQKFGNQPGLTKARAEIGGERTDSAVDMMIDISRDVLYAKEAFTRRPYPFPPPPPESWPCVDGSPPPWTAAAVSRR